MASSEWWLHEKKFTRETIVIMLALAFPLGTIAAMIVYLLSFNKGYTREK
jgi:hypothetical protein